MIPRLSAGFPSRRNGAKETKRTVGSVMVEPNFDKGEGLVPAVVQDHDTGEVLMMAYMNREAWLKTLETGKATFWSRSVQAKMYTLHYFFVVAIFLCAVNARWAFERTEARAALQSVSYERPGQ